MSETEIYILEGSGSFSGVSGPAHLGLALIKDGQLRIIHGLQSEGFGIPAGEVTVSNQQDLVFGNLIVDVQQVLSDKR